MWKGIIAVMTEILAMYQKLLIINKQKRVAIMQVQIDKLDMIIKQEQAVVNKITELEGKRRPILDKLIADRKITAPVDKFLDLLKYCDAATAVQLKELHTELLDTLAVVQRESDSNNKLIRAALGAVNYRRNQLTSAEVGPTYASKGTEQVSRKGIFNFEA